MLSGGGKVNDEKTTIGEQKATLYVQHTIFCTISTCNWRVQKKLISIRACRLYVLTQWEHANHLYRKVWMPSRKICIAFVPIIISITEKAFWCVPLKLKNMTENFIVSRVAQWKRAGPITQRSEDQNLALLRKLYFLLYILKKMIMTVTSTKKKFRIKNNIQIIDNNLINEWNWTKKKSNRSKYESRNSTSRFR